MIIVNKHLNLKNIARIGILGALGAILMMFDFPILFIAPSFYKLDLGDLPCLIGSFAMGPIPGLFIQIVKIIIKLLIKPTSTAFVGEIAAFIMSSTYCISAGYIYSLSKTKKNALKSLIISSIFLVIISSFINYVLIIPAYVSLYNISLETIISMGNKIIPLVKDKLSFILCCVAPFNLIKAIILDILALGLYKHISPLLK